MNANQTIAQYQALIDKATSIARRWTKAQERMRGAPATISRASITFKDDRVEFVEVYPFTTSRNSFPLSLLDDESELGTLAKKAIDLFNSTRESMEKELKELRAAVASRRIEELEHRIRTSTLEKPEGQPPPPNAAPGIYTGQIHHPIPFFDPVIVDSYAQSPYPICMGT